MTKNPTLVPYFSYEHARSAMAFLEAAFGFEPRQAFDGEHKEFGTRRDRCHDAQGPEWSFGTHHLQLEAPQWS